MGAMFVSLLLVLMLAMFWRSPIVGYVGIGLTSLSLIPGALGRAHDIGDVGYVATAAHMALAIAMVLMMAGAATLAFLLLLLVFPFLWSLATTPGELDANRFGAPPTSR